MVQLYSIQRLDLYSRKVPCFPVLCGYQEIINAAARNFYLGNNVEIISRIELGKQMDAIEKDLLLLQHSIRTNDYIAVLAPVFYRTGANGNLRFAFANLETFCLCIRAFLAS